MHNIHDAEENYLEAIVVLHRTQGEVRSIDLAHHLSLSRASVSNAIKKLEKEGHVIMQHDGILKLTPSGEAIGREIDDRHQTIKRWFLSLGISEENAENDACRIEHAISQETYDRVKAAFMQDASAQE